jgi:hypothetical protein
MAADALAAYKTDTNASKAALLICDTTEMADALNQRLHHGAGVWSRRRLARTRGSDSTSHPQRILYGCIAHRGRLRLAGGQRC